ncbi:MAG: carbon-nitrogen hydrolase family protein [Leptonema sp. (in: Bacteria)]|nr:carbon-nitrogen hydrolase family protein [Leptonema sp. (in: bacteria)]
MGLVKVTIFQKYLPDGLNLTTFKKLSSVKSDFLLLPEYFFADSSVKNPRDLKDKSQFALDWLIKLNSTYRGVIIGGSVVLEENGNLYNATPIIADGQIVDWYRKRNLTENEKPHVKPGEDPGIFMLGGHRFGVLICNDAKERSYFDELADQDVRLIFSVFNSPYRDESIEDKHERDEKLFIAPARENNLCIAKCCSTGNIMGHQVQGRSLVATPTGISWRVPPNEESEQILKTIIVQSS